MFDSQHTKKASYVSIMCLFNSTLVSEISIIYVFKYAQILIYDSIRNKISGTLF